MQAKFFRNLVFLVFLNILIKPFWIFGIDRTVQNVVGTEQYGFYFTIINFVLLFEVFLDLGITAFNNRNIARNKDQLKSQFSRILPLRLMLVFLFTLVVFGVAKFIGYDNSQLNLLIWVGLNQVLLSFVQYMRSNISGLLLLKTDSLISVLDRSLMILICSLLLWGNIFSEPFKIEWFVYAQTIAYGITMIVSTIVVLGNSGSIRLKFEWGFTKDLIKMSFPFAILTLVGGLFYRIDSVLIERILTGSTGEIQSGVFAQSYRIVGAVNNFSLLFAVLLFPIFSNMIKNKQSIKELLFFAFSMILVFTSIIIGICNSYAPEILDLLYTESFSNGEQILKILIIGILGMSVSYVFGSLLTANGNINLLIVITSIGMLIDIVLNYILIPEYQALGAAYASMSAHSIVLILLIISVLYVFRIRFGVVLLSKIFSYLLILTALVYLFDMLNINWILELCLYTICGLVLAFLLRLLSLRQMIAYLQFKE